MTNITDNRNNKRLIKWTTSQLIHISLMITHLSLSFCQINFISYYNFDVEKKRNINTCEKNKI
jgi:hypothetical protein